MTTPITSVALQRYRSALTDAMQTAIERTDRDSEAFYDGQALAFEKALALLDFHLSQVSQ